MRFAVLADINGNALALEAVLRDMDKLDLSTAVTLEISLVIHSKQVERRPCLWSGVFRQFAEIMTGI
jgi:hypothetical protein|tara:strand:- start:2012 stop:2212 length:201 start_codon:yes stop_codon:yes gene_type:complete